MNGQETYTDWISLFGDLGQPIPKLKKPEKQRLAKFLMSDQSGGIDRLLKLRMSLAAGVHFPIHEMEPQEIVRALGINGIARFIEKLTSNRTVVNAAIAVRCFGTSLRRENARPILASLIHFARRQPAKRIARSISAIGLTEIHPETASLILRTADRIASLVLASDTAQLSLKQGKSRDRFLVQLVDLAFETTNKCERAETSGLALEIVSFLRKRVGWFGMEKVFGSENQKLSYLASLPARLIPDILSGGCLRDAEFLSSRVGLIEEVLAGFSSTVRTVLDSKGSELPPASREWAERFLGYNKPPDFRTAPIDSESEVNLERLAALLLAAWEAKDEGQRSLHLFQVFSGVCKSAFHLTLAGEPESRAAFDPSLHEATGASILTGGEVTLLRPWVQWGESPVLRVIVRGLVAPVVEARS